MEGRSEPTAHASDAVAADSRGPAAVAGSVHPRGAAANTRFSGSSLADSHTADRTHRPAEGVDRLKTAPQPPGLSGRTENEPPRAFRFPVGCDCPRHDDESLPPRGAAGEHLREYGAAAARRSTTVGRYACTDD